MIGVPTSIYLFASIEPHPPTPWMEKRKARQNRSVEERRVVGILEEEKLANHQLKRAIFGTRKM